MKAKNFAWLELRPQLKFGDDDQEKALAIIRRATNFAFFVLKENGSMKIFVRVMPSEKKLFQSVPGLSVKDMAQPGFGSLVARYLVKRKPASGVPLLDPGGLESGNAYQRIWHEERDFLMACFACDATGAVLRKARSRAHALQRQERERGARLPIGRREELASALQRANGHQGYHRCCILFCTRAPRHATGKAGARNARAALDGFIGTVLPNRLKEMVARRSARVSDSRQGMLQRLAGIILGRVTIDPHTFVPCRFRPRTTVLSDSELAFFVALPRTDDVQAMNFGIGPTPTFVHGPREDSGSTDVTFQKQV